jgi:hypothetical protein
MYPWGFSYGFDPYGEYGGYGGAYAQAGTGALRLIVQPTSASVYVDGYYAGIVDDFDGMFQRLSLEPGPHRIEIASPGFEPLTVDVNIRDWDTTTFRGRLAQMK